MSIDFDDLAEGQPMSKMTLAQWARAQALRALLSSNRTASSLQALTYEVDAFAELIITGHIPEPKPGTFH